MKKINGKIYVHKNKINGKCYVGQTTKKPKERWGGNGKNYKNQYYFYNAIKKYGWDNFEHIVIEKIFKTIDELNDAEKFYIKKYNSFDNGYNSTTGGSGYIISEEHKKKIGISNAGKKRSKEHIQKIIDGSKGTKWSKERREKHPKNLPVETIKKMIGKKRSEKFKQFRRDFIYTPEIRKKMSKSQRDRFKDDKYVYQKFDKDWNLLKTYNQICDISDDMGKTNISSISRACNGKRKSASGFYWKKVKV